MLRTIAVASIVGVLSLGASVATAAQERMGEGDIERDIAGKRIFLKVPFGGEFPLYYAENGVVDGSGEKVGLGRFMAPKDQGKWWVADGRLCQQWQEWYDGKRHCFELTKTGDTSLYWKRDDGLEGEARIGQ